jgi:predicted MFS family arabinose efflux permease
MKNLLLAIRSPLSSLLFAEGMSTTVTLIADIALPIVAITRLDASALDIGLLGAASMGAPLIFGLSVGSLVNRFPLKNVFAFAGLFRIAILLVTSLTGWLAGLDIYALCAAGFLLSCAKLVTDTAMAVVVPSVISRRDLTTANSWLETVNSFAQSIGPLLCGILLRFVSLESIFSCSAFACAASSASLHRAVDGVEDMVDEGARSHFQDILDGLKMLWQNGFQRAIAFSAGLFNLFHTAFFTAFSLFAFRSLSFNESSFGLLLSLIGIAGVCGGFFASKIAQGMGARYALIGSLVIVGPLGIPVIFLEGLNPTFRIATIALCLGAWDFAVVVHLIIEASVRQLTVPVNQLSRIAATTRFISWGADPIGAALGGLLASSFLGYRGALACCLLGMSMAGASLIFSKSVRNVDDVLNKAQMG